MSSTNYKKINPAKKLRSRSDIYTGDNASFIIALRAKFLIVTLGNYLNLGIDILFYVTAFEQNNKTISGVIT